MRRDIHKAARRPAALLLPAVLISAMLCGCGPGGDLDTPGEALPDTGISVIAGSAPAYEEREAGTPGTVTAEGSVQAGEQDRQDGGAGEAAPGPEPSAAPVVTAGGSSQEAVPGIESVPASDTPDEIPDTGPAASWRDAISVSDIKELPADAHLIGMAALGIEDHSGAPYTIVHGGEPFFDAPAHPYAAVTFSALDDYGRSGPVYACVSVESLSGHRKSESTKWSDRPSGWQGLSYRGLVPGGALYRKQLLVPTSFYTGKLDGKNMLTATEYMRDYALEPLMAEIAEYLSIHGGYMAVRATPVYSGANAVCDGVLVEAASVYAEALDGEEPGGLKLCVFCHNVQPGVEIDYRNGLARVGDSEWTGDDAYGNSDYIINKHDGTFHHEQCIVVMNMYASWREEYRGQRSDLLDNNYEACNICQP